MCSLLRGLLCGVLHVFLGGSTEQLPARVPCPAAISLLPNSRVMFAVPVRTMSTMVLKALGESLSVGETKFPAALLTTM